jgi:hypothetical protein
MSRILSQIVCLTCSCTYPRCQNPVDITAKRSGMLYADVSPFNKVFVCGVCRHCPVSTFGSLAQ